MSERWPLTSIGEVLTQVWREEPVDPSKDFRLLGTRWYGGGLFTKDMKSGQEIRAKSLYRVCSGDFVYNRLFAWKGSFAVATDADDGAHVSNEFPCFVANRERVDMQFLRWCFTRQRAWAQALGLSSGATPTSRNRLKEALFLSMKVPLPALKEQRRIVALIEKLAVQINEARTLRLRTTEEAEALVKSARNEIVNEARTSHPDTELADVCTKITDGPHVSPRYVESGVPFISVRNISETGLDFSTAKHVTLSDHAEFSRKARVQRGDVLYTKGGTTGIARRVDTDREFSIWVHVALLKLDRSKAEAGFVEHMLNAPSSKEQAELFTRGSSNRDLGLSRMAKICFPLPPLAEQRLIVSKLDALQSQVNALKHLQAETAAELNAMLPAILDRAFKGEL